MRRVRRWLAWMLVRLAEKLDPEWLTRLRRSGPPTDGSPSFEYQAVKNLRERGHQRINDPRQPPCQHPAWCFRDGAIRCRTCGHLLIGADSSTNTTTGTWTR